MSELIATVVRIALYAALVASVGLAVGIIAPIILRFARKRDVETPKLDAAKHFAGILAATVSIIIAALNLFVPIGPRTESDPARKAIETFYGNIERHDFREAYQLIHPRRIEKIRERLPDFDESSFARAYATSRHHSGFLIDFISNDGSIGTRAYRVSFDVEDELPRNHLFLSRQQTFKEFIGEIPDAAALEKRIVDDITGNWDVPAARRKDVVDFIRDRQMEALLAPTLIADVGRVMGFSARESSSPSTTVLVNRHFVLELTMAEDGGQWKILDGLANPKAIAIYGTTILK